MSKIKNRLLQLIEIRGISKREFCRQIDVSHTYLNGDSEISSDKLEDIISAFPEVSLEWLVTGKEPMLLSEHVNDPLIFESQRSDMKKFMDFHMAEIQNKNAEIEKITKERDELKRKLAEMGKPSAKPGVSPSKDSPRT